MVQQSAEHLSRRQDHRRHGGGRGIAMIGTFAKNGCAVRRFHVERIDETSHGEMLMHFMLERILTGYAMGMDPFTSRPWKKPSPSPSAILPRGGPESPGAPVVIPGRLAEPNREPTTGRAFSVLPG